eukprot:c37004_g1_i1 orf=163-405(+)
MMAYTSSFALVIHISSSTLSHTQFNHFNYQELQRASKGYLVEGLLAIKAPSTNCSSSPKASNTKPPFRSQSHSFNTPHVD